MTACTFFGHKDSPLNIKPQLKETIIDLFENQGVDIFYVGNQGNFDSLVYNTLKELSTLYDFKFFVVLAYLPNKIHLENTIFPEGLETVPKKFAIYHRNMWMIKNSAFAITYIKYSFSNSSRFAEAAKKQGLKIINLA